MSGPPGAASSLAPAEWTVSSVLTPLRSAMATRAMMVPHRAKVVALRSRKPGDAVALNVMHGKDQKRITVVLAERPPNA